MAKDLKVKEENLPATMTAEEEALVADLMKGQTENTNAESFAIPFLKILQSNSPQCDAQEAAFIKEARAGMIFNTVTGALMNKIAVIQAHFVPEFLQWRQNRGGFAGRHHPMSPVARGVRQVEVDGRLRYLHPDCEDSLTDTRQHYVLYCEEGGDRWHPALLPMSSTQLKKSKKLMANVAEDETVGLLREYIFTTGGESNDAGNWYGWNIAPGEPIEDMTLKLAAAKFKASIRAGNVETDENQMMDSTAGAANPDEDDVPF